MSRSQSEQIFCPAGKPFDGACGLSTGAKTCFVTEFGCETETGLNDVLPSIE
jgi:hypothetical protein